MSCLKFVLFTLTSLFALHMSAGKFFPRPPPNNYIAIPWQVSVQVHSWHICGGAIIAPKWILTAAFCTSGLIAKSITIRVGSKSSRSGGSVVQVNQIFQPKEYDLPNHDYDFSLLELAKPLDFTNRIQTIALPNPTDLVEDDSICLISGWGDPKNIRLCRDSFYASIVPIVNQESCQEAYKSIHNITDRMICAGKGNDVKVTCRGDEGSPLVCGSDSSGTNVLQGIVSWAEGCGDPRYPGVYSRVSSVRAWIQNVTGV